jgi:hypothetical protein
MVALDPVLPIAGHGLNSAVTREREWMMMSAERKQDLDEIVRAVADEFSDDVQFSCSDESHTNFVAKWKLRDQPEALTQSSRAVLVRFADSALNRYRTLSPEQKSVAMMHLRELIRVRMADYDEGRQALRGEIKPPHIINTAPEFLAD